MDKRLLLQELADLLALRAGITKKKADAFAKSFFELVQHGLETDSFVKIKGFGTFKLVAVGERESVNISTGERFQISGHTKVSFTPDPELRDLINRPFAHFQTVALNDDTSLDELEAVDGLLPEEEEPETTPMDDDTEETAQETTPDQTQDQEDTYAEKLPADDSTLSHGETLESVTKNGPTQSDTPADGGQKLSEEMHNVLKEIQDMLIQEGELPESMTEDTSEESATDTAEESAPEAAATESAPSPAQNNALTEKEATAAEEGTPQPEELPAAADTLSALSTEIPVHMEEPEDKAETLEMTPPNEEEVTNVFSSVAPLPAPTCPAAGTFCWWKALATGTVVLLLMIVSYCAGYFHLLCPCDFNGHWNTRSEVAKSDEEATPPAATVADSGATVTTADTTVRDNAVTAPDPMPQPMPSEHPAPAKETTHPEPTQPVPAAPAPVASQPAPKKAQSRQYAQVPGGKYIITGTRQKYTLSRGETIRSVAEHVYGSKGYASYIIAYNRLSNPDNIAAGTEILLPELERASTN